MEEHEGSVAEIIAGKLNDDNVPDQLTSLILNAMRGSGARGDAVMPRKAGSRPEHAASTPSRSPSMVPRHRPHKPTVYLTPGPRLAVVTGRNGSGKSSFAEAAELALTGENERWGIEARCVRRADGTCTSSDTAAIASCPVAASVIS
jgi:hypothetical protein